MYTYPVSYCVIGHIPAKITEHICVYTIIYSSGQNYVYRFWPVLRACSVEYWGAPSLVRERNTHGPVGKHFAHPLVKPPPHVLLSHLDVAVIRPRQLCCSVTMFCSVTMSCLVTLSLLFAGPSSCVAHKNKVTLLFVFHILALSVATCAVKKGVLRRGS